MPSHPPRRRPVTLAALATAAVPGLDVVAVGPHPQDGGDTDIALLQDSSGHRWVVRAPAGPTAGARLEGETRLLQAVADRLPFAVPVPAGASPLPEGGRCVVHHELQGRPLPVSSLTSGPGLTAGLGAALAAIHDIPLDVAEDAGVVGYEPGEYRDRRLAEVDRAAATGHVPPRLLQRWEHAMEDVSRWHFHPVLTHGDLVSDHVLVEGDRVTAVLGWGDAQVADPADDLAWLATGTDDEVFDTVLEAYALGRRDQPDRHLADRARLAGELALARWLLHGVRGDDDAVVADAVQMLVDLDHAVSDES